MARDFNGTSSDYIEETATATSFIEGFTAITFSFWIWPDNFTSEYKPMGQWNGNFDQSVFLINLQNGAAAGKVGCILAAASSSDSSNRRSSGVLTSGQWNHVIITWVATDTFTFRLNGSDSAPETWITSDTIATPGSSGSRPKMRIGAAADGGYLDGKMAEVAIWNRVLTSDEQTGLAGGESPDTYLSNLKFYVPLLNAAGAVEDLMDRKGFTINGTSLSTHPSITYPTYNSRYLMQGGI